MMMEDAARSCPPSQSDSESCEELRHESDEQNPKSTESLDHDNGALSTPNIKVGAEESLDHDNGALSTPNIKGGAEEAAAADRPSPSFKYSLIKTPKPESPAGIAFPMARVLRLIRSEGDIRTNADATFLINKAAERFLEQFVEDSFEYVLKENKNTLSYKNLSSNVSNQKRYEFLADFVPEKVKAADALSEKASAELTVLIEK